MQDISFSLRNGEKKEISIEKRRAKQQVKNKHHLPSAKEKK